MEYKVIKDGLLKAEGKHLENLVELKKKYDSDGMAFTHEFTDNVYDIVKDLDKEELKSLFIECMKDEDISQGIFLALVSSVAKAGKTNGR